MLIFINGGLQPVNPGRGRGSHGALLTPRGRGSHRALLTLMPGCTQYATESFVGKAGRESTY